jgi:hypothetical protein
MNMGVYQEKPEHYCYHRDTNCFIELHQKAHQIWAKLPKDQKPFWKAEEWRHNQPPIKDTIVHARIECDIDGLCCASTIHSWLNSEET